MANNPYVNKVKYGEQTLIDLTADTVTPSDVLEGVTFHDRSGAPQTGSLVTHEIKPKVVQSGYLTQGKSVSFDISSSKTYIIVGSRNIATTGLQQVVYKVQNATATNIGGSNGGLSARVSGTVLGLTSTATSSGPIVSYTVTRVD